LPVPFDVTVVIAGLGLWLGIAILFVGLVGPLVVRNPRHRRTFDASIAVGVVMILVGMWLMVGALGGPDVVAPEPGE
jgi:hypothetical protein